MHLISGTEHELYTFHSNFARVDVTREVSAILVNSVSR